MSRALTRREFLRRAGFGLAGLTAFRWREETMAQAPEEGRPPNILFILADDLGYGDLGCYGQQVLETPHLDRLAAEGTRFTQVYAASTVCAPSRCGLMTGYHMGHAWVRGNQRIPLRPEDRTVAELLREAGYATGIVGKWGLGEPDTTGIPNRQGFDYWFGFLNQRRAHNYYPEYVWENTEKYPLPGNENGRREQYIHDLFTERALQFVRDHRDRPFFLYLAYTLPHANNELGRETGNGMEVPDYGPYADRDWPEPEKGFAGMVHRLDRDVGRLMALLQELGIDEQTIVFFSSDNGPHREGGHDSEFFDSNGPLRGIKRDLYEGGIRVPMIVRWPGRVPAGRVSDHVWTFWDFLPTAAELAGVPAPQGVDGISMMPALLGESGPEHEYLYWEFYERGGAQAVRMGEWKAVRKWKGNPPTELYHLGEDVGETRNLADQHPDLVRKMEALMAASHVDNENYRLPEELRG